MVTSLIFSPKKSEGAIFTSPEKIGISSVVVPENDYIELRYIINLTLQKLRLPIHRVLKNIQPYRPLLIDIALSVKSVVVIITNF